MSRTAAFAVAVALGGLAACDDAEVRPVADGSPGGMTGMPAMGGADSGAMPMAPPMMAGYSQEMDTLVAGMRRHVETMRRLPPEQWD